MNTPTCCECDRPIRDAWALDLVKAGVLVVCDACEREETDHSPECQAAADAWDARDSGSPFRCVCGQEAEQ